jgi:hypothetical protein
MAAEDGCVSGDSGNLKTAEESFHRGLQRLQRCLKKLLTVRTRHLEK